MRFSDYLAFGWKYNKVFRIKSIQKPSTINSISYVTEERTRDWILGSKARRLALTSSLNAEVSYVKNYLDHIDADGYFYLHPNFFAKSLIKQANIINKKNVVMFTHPVLKNKSSIRHRVFVLQQADKVIFLNKAHAKLMTDNGLDASKVEIMHLASDARMFEPHERKGGKICMSMAYYERKNPMLMFDVIKAMPHRDFMLIGPNWKLFKHYKELINLPNFEYYSDLDYIKYADYYKQCDVFFSPSFLEGGPVPLLETMLCNMVPVTSKTGYCVDILEHGKNGFLFDAEASKEEVIPLIESAYELKYNTRESVKEFTWEKYSKKIDDLFLGN